MQRQKVITRCAAHESKANRLYERQLQWQRITSYHYKSALPGEICTDIVDINTDKEHQCRRPATAAFEIKWEE